MSHHFVFELPTPDRQTEIDRDRLKQAEKDEQKGRQMERKTLQRDRHKIKQRLMVPERRQSEIDRYRQILTDTDRHK